MFIARVMLKNAPFLILNAPDPDFYEATALADAENEAKVHAAFLDLSKG